MFWMKTILLSAKAATTAATMSTKLLRPKPGTVLPVGVKHWESATSQTDRAMDLRFCVEISIGSLFFLKIV